MFTVHADGLIAGDVFESPPLERVKSGFLGLTTSYVASDPPALAEPAPGATLSKQEEWWRDHVAQLQSWARQRYGVELDREQSLVLMGVGHPTINWIELSGAEYMLATPHGVSTIDDGQNLSYRFGLVQPGGSGIELPVRWRP